MAKKEEAKSQEAPAELVPGSPEFIAMVKSRLLGVPPHRLLRMEKAAQLDSWPPRFGVWAGHSRNMAMVNMPLRPGEDLYWTEVDEPGAVVNGVAILGPQLLQEGVRNDVLAGVSAQRQNEIVFKNGGKVKTNYLGRVG